MQNSRLKCMHAILGFDRKKVQSIAIMQRIWSISHLVIFGCRYKSFWMVIALLLLYTAKWDTYRQKMSIVSKQKRMKRTHRHKHTHRSFSVMTLLKSYSFSSCERFVMGFCDLMAVAFVVYSLPGCPFFLMSVLNRSVWAAS